MGLREGKYAVLEVYEQASMDSREHYRFFRNRDDPNIKETIQEILSREDVRRGWTKVTFALFEVEAKRIPLEYSKKSEVKVG